MNAQADISRAEGYTAPLPDGVLAFFGKLFAECPPSSNREALNLQADVIEIFCKKRGFSVRRRYYPTAGDSLVIELCGDAERSHVAPLAHMDTVHATGVFGNALLREENGVLYGPGVFDCKGGIALCLLAMDAISLSGVSHRTVRLI